MQKSALFLVAACALCFGQDPQGGLFQRIIIGAEGSGGAAANATGRYFTDIFVSAPVSFKPSRAASTPAAGAAPSDQVFGPKFRLWVDTRITSVPQQFNAKVSDFNIADGFKDLKVNQVAQAFEMLGGGEYRMFNQENPRKDFGADLYSRTSISVIGTYGGTTPFVPTDFVDSFNIPPKNSDAYDRLKAVYGSALDRRPEATVIAFVPEDHGRFWRQYYGGVRIQSFFFSKRNDGTGAGYDASDVPPRTVDLLFGQNEVVTGGRLRGSVFRADFFQPIWNFGDHGAIYVFGTAVWKTTAYPGAAHDSIILSRPTGPVAFDDPATLLVTPLPSNRDFYRFGIGYDLSRIFGKK